LISENYEAMQRQEKNHEEEIELLKKGSDSAAKDLD